MSPVTWRLKCRLAGLQTWCSVISVFLAILHIGLQTWCSVISVFLAILHVCSVPAETRTLLFHHALTSPCVCPGLGLPSHPSSSASFPLPPGSSGTVILRKSSCAPAGTCVPHWDPGSILQPHHIHCFRLAGSPLREETLPL